MKTAVLIFMCCTLVMPAGRAQENPSIARAKAVLDSLEQDRFEDVAKQFNARVAAAMSADQLRATWLGLRQQVGHVGAIVDQQVMPGGAATAVVLGCHFEKADLNVIVSFDADDRIAGLRMTPRASAEVSSPPPASAKFKEEPVTVGAGEWALPGTLSMPIGPVTAAVVLVHGSGPGDRDETVGANKPFRDLAWGLADRGIAVLRYEKRTRQYAAKLAGNPNFTVRDETIDDALQAAAVLRRHDRIDPRRVFVLGHSLGGTLAPRIAAADPAIAGIVIMAGATRPLLDSAREQIEYLASLAHVAAGTEEALRALRAAAPAAYWADLDAYNPARAAAALTIPMLILQGERDYQVTLKDLAGWRDALTGRANVTIKTYPDLNHLFLPGTGKSTPAEYDVAGHIPDAVLDDIAQWIANHAA